MLELNNFGWGTQEYISSGARAILCKRCKSETKNFWPKKDEKMKENGMTGEIGSV